MRFAGLGAFGCVLFLIVSAVFGQVHSPADHSAPGDEQIQSYLRLLAERLDARFLDGVQTAGDWERIRPRLQEQYFFMLGLSPLPPKTPLQATVTRSLARDGYVVDMLHFQSRPGLYVTANLYRPASTREGRRFPAVLYLCGHSNKGRNGNKTAYQSHGIWFARHGYICLTLDSLQLGEIGGIHHGTYREGRWWWYSRGYTPAGVECWNGVRGLDYLLARPDVDPERIAVTGISGGGAATYWVAAADERVKVAVPVSGMADLESYVVNRMVNGHCDCMFLYNTFEWPWTTIAALIAPRPLLFVNSNKDRIFPMDANERIINRLERLYSLFGAGDRVDAVVSIGGHDYRADIRRAAYRFINTHLKGDPREVTDSEVDLVSERSDDTTYPIPPEELRVFPVDADIPSDQRNTTIDRDFVARADVQPPAPGQYDVWKQQLLGELRRVSFCTLPERVPEARIVQSLSSGDMWLSSEPRIEFRIRKVGNKPPAEARRVVLVVAGADDAIDAPDWLTRVATPDDAVYVCEPRGIGASRWTRKNPPNYVERALALLGRTADTGRVWDVAAAARRVHVLGGGHVPVTVTGQHAAGIVGACAALLEPEIAEVVLVQPPSSFLRTDNSTPQFLNVLRVCDLSAMLGMLAPRPLRILDGERQRYDEVAAIYAAAGARDRLTFE